MKKQVESFIFRKANSIEELKRLTHKSIVKGGIESKCKIIDFISLDQNIYFKFTKSLLSDYDFLEPFRNNTIYQDGIWNCVLITLGNREETGILVACEGSKYARYSGLLYIQ